MLVNIVEDFLCMQQRHCRRECEVRMSSPSLNISFLYCRGCLRIILRWEARSKILLNS